MRPDDLESKHDHPVARGRPPGADIILKLARRVTTACGRPVVGGVAVMLHGYGRLTRDIDVYSDDFRETHTRLEAAGFKWNQSRREHIIDDVPIHMVGDDSLGGPPKRSSTIEGVKVIGLADLIRGKLTVGLAEVNRAKDIADVVELIRIIPLRKDFAGKLPTRLRAPFKELVEQVHGPRRTTLPTLQFWKKYA
jgi:hypothetical protein